MSKEATGTVAIPRALWLIRALLLAAVVVCAIGFATWGGLALWYRAPFAEPVRIGLAACWSVLMLGAAIVLFTKRRWQALAAMAFAVAALLTWWSTILPQSVRDWAPDVAQTVRGEVSGDILTLTGVRNFDWRSETDFTPRWETRRYDLSKPASVDLIADYWAGETIAHTIVSFGFSDGQFLAWSIELRKTRNEAWSAIAGFFKQSELITLAGDERDLIRLRTNVRHEDLRIYRLNADPALARKALLAYVAEANALADEPHWYNTATTNCTTVVFKIARIVEPGFPLDWRVFVSGYFPDYAYDRHALDQSMPFAQLRELAKIAGRANAADAAPSEAFSQAIRVGVPGTAPRQ